MLKRECKKNVLTELNSNEPVIRIKNKIFAPLPAQLICVLRNRIRVGWSSGKQQEGVRNWTEN